MDEDLRSDARVSRQTVVHLQTLAIAHGKRLSEIERHVRDIKAVVVTAMISALVASLYHFWKG